MTKLQLDDAVGGQEKQEDGKDDNTSKEVRKSLLTTLRNKFEAGGDVMEVIPEIKEEEKEVKKEEKVKKEVKKARGSVAVKEE